MALRRPPERVAQLRRRAEQYSDALHYQKTAPQNAACRSIRVKDFWGKEYLVLRERIELSTSPLPMECSTTELPQRFDGGYLP